MVLTVSADVASFDDSAVRAALLGEFPGAVDVVITVTAGSVTLTVRLIMTSALAADRASSSLASMSTASLSSTLGVAVTSASSPFVAVEAIPAPAPVSPIVALNPLPHPAPPSASAPPATLAATGTAPPAPLAAPQSQRPANASLDALSDAASEQLAGQVETHMRMDALHIYLPLSLLVLFICTACCCRCWYQVQHAKAEEEAFSEMIQRAEEEGQIVRASTLESPRPTNSSEECDPRAAQSPVAPHRPAPMLKTVEVELDDAMRDQENRGNDDATADTKKLFSLVAATRARLHLDKRTNLDQRARQRGERARNLNRTRIAAAVAAVPSWDHSPTSAREQRIVERSPCVDKTESGSVPGRMSGSPRSGYRVRPALYA